MNEKILFWIGDAIYRFGISKALIENYDCLPYAVIDVDHKQKRFFETQKLVNFEKKWFYRDHVILDANKRPDLEYLAEFEEKYKINLWDVIYSERYFYKFNETNFSSSLVLSILTQECKLFETVLDDIKPDFLVIGTTDLHHNHLLYQLCKSKDIGTLMMTGARFGFKELICTKPDNFDGLIHPVFPDNVPERDFPILQKYLQKFDNVKQINRFKQNLQVPVVEKLRKLLKLLFEYGDVKFQDQFEHYGMNGKKIFLLLMTSKIQKYKVRSFLEKNTTKQINPEDRFVYFPLHTEPERALSIAAPYYTNQIEVITNIAKSLPVDHKLYVKDHPGMAFKGGKGRTISFFQEILDLPNVVLLHPSINQREILKKCSLVVTINGTTGLEAAFFGKPTVAFATSLYSNLKSVRIVKEFQELRNAIEEMLAYTFDPDDLNNFVEFIEKNSFEVDRKLLISDFRNRFLYRELDNQEMKQYFQLHEESFLTIAQEYIRKIQKLTKK